MNATKTVRWMAVLTLALPVLTRARHATETANSTGTRRDDVHPHPFAQHESLDSALRSLQTSESGEADFGL